MDTYLYLGLAGCLAFAFSTLAGGGGALLLVPVTEYFIGVKAVSPVVHLGNFLGRPTRIFLFRKNICWQVVKWYLPLAMLGAWFGAWLFSSVSADILRLVVAIFLISVLWQFKLGKKKTSFEMKAWYFAPVGLVVAFLSTLIGATGPVLNPFYLNYGISKEELIATKAVNSFLLAIVQLSSFSFFGALYGKLWGYGLAIGVGAAIGNIIGKKLLARISDNFFRKLLLGFTAFSGILILFKWVMEKFLS